MYKVICCFVVFKKCLLPSGVLFLIISYISFVVLLYLGCPFVSNALLLDKASAQHATLRGSNTYNPLNLFYYFAADFLFIHSSNTLHSRTVLIPPHTAAHSTLISRHGSVSVTEICSQGSQHLPF